MTGLPELLRDSVTEATAATTMPARLADRAIVQGGRRRRRQRATLVGGAALLVAAAIAVPLTVIAGRPPVPPSTTVAQNAVFAAEQGEHWRILDPETGAYRLVAVGSVSTPTTDLRAAAVTPWEGGRRVGRYDTTTGDIRWYDIPFAAQRQSISPDGRYVLATADPGDFTGTDVALVDLESGEARALDLAREISAARMADSWGWGIYSRKAWAEPVIMWHPDSRHLVIGHTVLDLEGRRTGTVQAPRLGVLIAFRPGGGQSLVVLKGTSTYTVLDSAGAVVRQVPAAPLSCLPRKVPCPPDVMSFVAWRGPDELLVTATAVETDYTQLDVLDLRDGSRRTVRPARPRTPPPNEVVVSAEHLSSRARALVAF